jgi:hypothetical protein
VSTRPILTKWLKVDFQDGMKWLDVCGRVRNTMKSLDVTNCSHDLAQDFVLGNLQAMIQNALGTVPDNLVHTMERIRAGENTEQMWKTLFAALRESCPPPA